MYFTLNKSEGIKLEYVKLTEEHIPELVHNYVDYYNKCERRASYAFLQEIGILCGE